MSMDLIIPNDVIKIIFYMLNGDLLTQLNFKFSISFDVPISANPKIGSIMI
jgi:hypothetical protein